MKKLVALMLVFVMVFTALPVFAEEVQPQQTEELALQLTVAPDDTLAFTATASANKAENAKKAAPRIDKSNGTGIVMFDQNGKGVPTKGLPLTKKTELTVRVSLTGGSEGTTAKGRVSIGTSAKDSRKDVASVLLKKVKLDGTTDFTFKNKDLKELKLDKKYKVFLRTADSKQNPAIDRVQIGTIIVTKKAAETDALEAAGSSEEETAIDEQAENSEELELTEATADAGETDEAGDAAAKDLRHALRITSDYPKYKQNNQAIPATGFVLGAANALTVELGLTGGSSTDKVNATVFIGDVLEKTMSVATAGVAKFDFTPAEMAMLTAGTAYDVWVAVEGGNLCQPIVKSNTDKQLLIAANAARVQATLGTVGVSPAIWDLASDSARDVVLTIGASSPVEGAFTISGKNIAGDDVTVTATGTLSQTASTTVTFAAAELLTLAPGSYNIMYALNPTADISANSGETGKTLTVTGTGRADTAITVSSTVIEHAMFSEDPLELTLTSSLTGENSYIIDIGGAVKYVADKVTSGTKFQVPASALNQAFVDGTLEGGKTYDVKAEFIGSAANKPCAATVIARLSIKTETNDLWRFVDVVSIYGNGKFEDLNGNIALNGYGFSLGDSKDLVVKVDIYATKHGIMDDVDSALTIYDSNNVAKITAKQSLNGQLFSPITLANTGDFKNVKGKCTVSYTFKHSDLNKLMVDNVTYNIRFSSGATSESLEFKAGVHGVNYKAAAFLRVNDDYAPTPTYAGKTNFASKWTKGDSSKKLGSVYYTGGISGLKAKALIIATKIKPTAAGVVPSGAISFTERSVYIDGTESSYTLDKTNLNKLAIGSYYLYVMCKAGDANQATDWTYIGAITVSAAATGSGTGNKTDDTDDTDTSDTTVSDTPSSAVASDVAAADHVSFGTYQMLGMNTLEWMIARQPLMGREFLKYLMNQKAGQRVAIPLAPVPDMELPITIPIIGAGQYILGTAMFEPWTEGETTGYTFTVESNSGCDLSQVKMHLGSDFDDLNRELTDADYYLPGAFIPVSGLVLAQIDGIATYNAADAEVVVIDSAVTNRITEWMSLS